MSKDRQFRYNYKYGIWECLLCPFTTYYYNAAVNHCNTKHANEKKFFTLSEFVDQQIKEGRL